MMPKRKDDQLVVRGVMKRGVIQLIDDVKIANGTLLDIVVVETPEEKGLKAAKKKRERTPGSLRYSLVGKKQLTDDPLQFLKRLGKSKVSNVRFEDYRATCHFFPCDMTCSIAEYMLGLKPPPTKVAKAFRKAIRQRTRFEFNPGTRAAQKTAIELREFIDGTVDEFDDAISLWYAAINPIVGNLDMLETTLTELFEYGPLLAVEQAQQTKRVGATKAGQIRETSIARIEADLKGIVLNQLKRAAIRSRKKNSSPAESQKLIRKELSEIARRLEAAISSNAS